MLSGQEIQHHVRFLPPYTPQLNPIETIFSLWKAAVKREHMNERNNDVRLTSLIHRTASCITKEKSENIYAHVTRCYVHCAAGLPLDEKYNPSSYEQDLAPL